mgnify:CR=1 FL=1
MTFLVDFEMIPSVSGLINPAIPRSILELEDDDGDDEFSDYSPWLDLRHCNCNFTTLPRAGSVLYS